MVTAFSIQVRDSGESFSCNGDKSILGGMEALRRKGIPVGCRSGGCGVCKIRIEKGAIRRGPTSREHVSVEEEADGVALACRCYPEADLELTVLGKMRRSFEPRNTVLKS
jgi:ferredoxin